MKLVIVSGVSGSGKSITLNTFEDLGHYCIDNLPIALLPAFAEQMLDAQNSDYKHAAVGIDIRNLGSDLKNFPAIVEDLRKKGIHCEIYFLQAENNTLIKRYSETRRTHPLCKKDMPLADAIRTERALLDPIAASADLYIDTTHTNVHQLRGLIRDRVLKSKDNTISVLFESFGFKHGVPSDADFVFDLRCLPNPHWEPTLRPLTGMDHAVVEFLNQQPDVEQMYQDISQFIQKWIRSFEAENRSYLTIAVGCTGGQHRSVYMAERLADQFQQAHANVLTKHREL